MVDNPVLSLSPTNRQISKVLWYQKVEIVAVWLLYEAVFRHFKNDMLCIPMNTLSVLPLNFTGPISCTEYIGVA